MTACLRSPKALLVLLVCSAVASESFARKPEPAPERERSTQKADPRYEIHKVRKGETLWSVAMDYHTSAGEIMDLNDMDSSRIIAGQNLKIPHAIGKGGAPVVRQKSHIVGEDETMHGIAKSYGISEESLLRANPDVNPRRLRPGTRLLIPNAFVTTGNNLDAPPKIKENKAKEVPTSVHVVKDNETFTSIARQYHLNVADVMAANPGVQPERLHEGMKLKIPGARPPSKEAPSPKKSTYIVQPGDTLERISRHEGVSVGALMSANRIANPHVIPVGTILMIPGGQGSPLLSSSAPAPTQPPYRSAVDPYGPPVRNEPEPRRIVQATKPANAVRPKITQSVRPAPSRAQRPFQQVSKPAPGSVEFSYEKQAIITKPNYQPQAAPAPKYGAGERVKPHWVTSGETVESIASSNNVSAKRIREHNHLGANTRLRPGDEIMIPLTDTVASR